MARPRLQEGDPRFEERRNKAKERLVRLLRELNSARELVSTLEKQIAEELEVAG